MQSEQVVNVDTKSFDDKALARLMSHFLQGSLWKPLEYLFSERGIVAHHGELGFDNNSGADSRT